MAEVVVELSNKEILRVPLKGQSMTIGRDPTCDLHLDNKALSRKHAQIEKRGAAIWVRDLGSQNGTYVNGEKITEPLALNGGDKISVGRYDVRIEGAEAAKVDTPVLTLTGPEGKHRFAMVGDEIIIGRAPSCDIAISHKSISRRHLRILVRPDGGFTAEDLGSQNGTRLNNKRMQGATPFEKGDKLYMSEFIVEIGSLEPSPDMGDGDKASKTMMIDRSELAKAAYVGGDFEKMASNAANISLGHQGKAGPGGVYEDELDLDDDESATRGVPSEAAALPPPASTPRAGTPAPPSPLVAAARPNAGMAPSLTTSPVPRRRRLYISVRHPELEDREIDLTGDITRLGEDGLDDDSTGGRYFANQGYLLFVKAASGTVVTAAGDRQLVTVNGAPCLFALAQDGDVVELGLLSVTFHG